MNALVMLGCLLFSDHAWSDETSIDAAAAYPGIAEGMWTTAWGSAGSENIEIVASVISDHPLSADAPEYLLLDFQDFTGRGNSIHLLQRGYATTELFDTTEPHRFSFLLRIDDLSKWHSGNSIFICDSPPVIRNFGRSEQEGITWAIVGQEIDGERRWTMGNGGGFEHSLTEDGYDPGLWMLEDHVYSFTVLVDPQNNRYRVHGVNLDHVEGETPGVPSFTSDWLAFEAPNHQVAENLVIGTRMIGATEPESRKISLSEIRFAPDS